MHLLYLDFDGILHPAGGERNPRGFRLNVPGHEVFESVPVLEQAIAPYPSLRIVLTTSWVQAYGFRQTCEFLPKSMQPRVIGATFDSRHLISGDFNELSRYAQILVDVRRREPTRWLAVDDDAQGWPHGELDALVLVPAAIGLACTDAQALLRSRLAARFS